VTLVKCAPRERQGQGKDRLRLASDPHTKAYVNDAPQKGLRTAEIIRGLKRYVAREPLIYCPENSSFDSRSITYRTVTIMLICDAASCFGHQERILKFGYRHTWGSVTT
jgi:hypothetical protein